RKMLGQQVKESGAILCIFASELSPRALVDTGSLSERLWIRLNQEGYGVHPLTIPSLLSYDLQMGLLPSNFPVKYRVLLEEGKDILTQQFEAPSHLSPVWMFRVGKAPPL